jgi:hypothetical protein
MLRRNDKGYGGVVSTYSMPFAELEKDVIELDTIIKESSKNPDINIIGPALYRLQNLVSKLVHIVNDPTYPAWLDSIQRVQSQCTQFSGGYSGIDPISYRSCMLQALQRHVSKLVSDFVKIKEQHVKNEEKREKNNQYRKNKEEYNKFEKTMKNNYIRQGYINLGRRGLESTKNKAEREELLAKGFRQDQLVYNRGWTIHPNVRTLLSRRATNLHLGNYLGKKSRSSTRKHRHSRM